MDNKTMPKPIGYIHFYRMLLMFSHRLLMFDVDVLLKRFI